MQWPRRMPESRDWVIGIRDTVKAMHTSLFRNNQYPPGRAMLLPNPVSRIPNPGPQP